jgi:hypothetical protein
LQKNPGINFLLKVKVIPIEEKRKGEVYLDRLAFHSPCTKMEEEEK